MKEMRLFHITDEKVVRQPASLFQYERELQDLLEQHLHDFLSVHLLESYYQTDTGEIDSLGIDDAGRPVIIEYKREKDKNVVGQALGYLGWLQRNQAKFTLLVIRKLNQERANRIRWAPRLLIIASDFRDAQVDAARNVSQIELLCYRRYGTAGFALEWVHGGTEEPLHPPLNLNGDEPDHVDPEFDRYKNWGKTNEEVRALFFELLAFAQKLGPVRLDVFETQFSFRRTKGAEASLKWPPVFAQAMLNLSTGIRVYVLKRTQSVDQVEGLARPTTDHLIIHINTPADLERAKPLLRDSYERY